MLFLTSNQSNFTLMNEQDVYKYCFYANTLYSYYYIGILYYRPIEVGSSAHLGLKEFRTLHSTIIAYMPITLILSQYFYSIHLLFLLHLVCQSKSTFV